MKALTIKQPWATLIMRCGKDIENRDWKTSMRGIVAIHTSAKLQRADVEDACSLMRSFIPKFSDRIFTQEAMTSPERYPIGSIVGTVEIVDCVTASDSPWFVGDYGFVLRNPVCFETPIPCRGVLSFWNIPEHLLPEMREQYRKARATSRPSVPQPCPTPAP